jgi:hypothetical protein
VARDCDHSDGWVDGGRSGQVPFFHGYGVCGHSGLAALHGVVRMVTRRLHEGINSGRMEHGVGRKEVLVELRQYEPAGRARCEKQEGASYWRRAGGKMAGWIEKSTGAREVAERTEYGDGVCPCARCFGCGER